ncbi:MAG: LytTR family transcriptional regulator [Candidatus Riflebacteria bacterium]|nr:LytTR family transcriptional regulator [Candidatus Riflebacteria bacterium]
MKKSDSEVLQQILERLLDLDPPIKKFPVAPPDPAMAIYFVDLKDVCYITTKSDQGRNETMFVTYKNEMFYSNLGLSEIEEKLKEHPHFLRSCKYFIINLTKIRGLKVSNARDLWFEGIEQPVLNAVTNTYLEEFEKRFK